MTLDELYEKVYEEGSVLERVFIYHWKFAGGSPSHIPEWQYQFDPSRKWRFDFVFLEQRLAIEVDGGRWKPGGGKHGTPEDYDKINQAVLQGWRVLRFTGEMLNSDPFACIQIVLRGLGIEGAIKHGD